MAKNQRIWYRRVFSTAHKILLERFLRASYKKIYGRVLVIGAGKEPYKKLLPYADSVVVTDIGDWHSGLDCISDAHSLPFHDESFDFVMAVEVFEHLQSPVRAAAEIQRVLKHGGKSLITVPFMFRIHADPHDYQRHTKSGLELVFAQFEEVNVQAFGGRLQVISDILTTATQILAIFRFFNWLICLPIFSQSSNDCPSGYYIELRK